MCYHRQKILAEKNNNNKKKKAGGTYRLYTTVKTKLRSPPHLQNIINNFPTCNKATHITSSILSNPANKHKEVQNKNIFIITEPNTSSFLFPKTHGTHVHHQHLPQSQHRLWRRQQEGRWRGRGKKLCLQYLSMHGNSMHACFAHLPHTQASTPR